MLLLSAAVGTGWALATFFPSDQSGAPTAQLSGTTLNASDEATMDLNNVVTSGPLAVGVTAELAESGDPKAQFELGMSYRNGQAGTPDPAKAYSWLQKSAQQNYADAQYVLGTLHLAGHGVLQSFPAAFEWFEKAAQQNHAEAQFNLGRMYRRGYGVETSHVKAYMWFNLAAAQGHDRAREARDNLLPLMTPDQIRAAQRESHEWRPMAAQK